MTPAVTFRAVSRHFGQVKAVDQVNLDIAEGEFFAMLGPSGSGKTTLGRTLVGLETPTRGRIEIGGVDASSFAAMNAADRTATRRTIQMVFQDPYSTLNPRHSVRRSLSEAIGTIGRLPAVQVEARVAELLREVGLPEDYADRRPSSLSGGERQRVAIARALAAEPAVMVCDEITSALDVSVQAAIIDLLRELRTSMGLSLLFITHNLALIRTIADRVAVMTEGRIVELAPTADVLERPSAPYTQQLLANTRPGMDPEWIRPFLEVRAEYARAALDAATARFGSFDAYVEVGLGVNDQTLERLRAELLE